MNQHTRFVSTAAALCAALGIGYLVNGQAQPADPVAGAGAQDSSFNAGTAPSFAPTASGAEHAAQPRGPVTVEFIGPTAGNMAVPGPIEALEFSVDDGFDGNDRYRSLTIIRDVSQLTSPIFNAFALDGGYARVLLRAYARGGPSKPYFAISCETVVPSAVRWEFRNVGGRMRHLEIITLHCNEVVRAYDGL